MAFMSKRKQGKVVVQVVALVIVLAFVAGMVVLGGGSFFSGTGVTNNNSNTNNSAYTEDQFNKSIKSLQDLIQKDPNDIKLTESLAGRNFEFALFYLKASSDKNNTKKQAEYLQKATEQFNLAIKGLEKVVQADPQNAPSLGDLATAYFYTNRVDDAIKTANKALEADPKLTVARINLANYYAFGKNDYKTAIAELKKIPSNDSNYQQAKTKIDEFTKEAAKPVQSTTPGTNSPTKK